MVRFSVYGKNFGGVFTLKMGEISGDGDIRKTIYKNMCLSLSFTIKKNMVDHKWLVRAISIMLTNPLNGKLINN